MNKEQVYSVRRIAFMHYADVYFSAIKDAFLSATKEVAKEKYGIEINHELEMLLKGAYQIGFADAMFLGVEPDED